MKEKWISQKTVWCLMGQAWKNVADSEDGCGILSATQSELEALVQMKVSKFQDGRRRWRTRSHRTISEFDKVMP